MQYQLDPQLRVEDVAALRMKAGWDSREAQLKFILGKTYLTAACFDNTRLVGIVDVISDGVDDALIRNLLVDPEFHRAGIALKLLELVKEKLKTDRIKTVNVLFEPELKELYEKAGFRIVCGGIIDNEKEGF
ncbi:MAG: GNAT family N-acetyltransferase [Bacillota bacterium]